jgi:hypothetical protein
MMTNKYKSESTSLFINFGPLYQPITDLAKRLNVSASSIVRTCCTLALKAYENNLELTADQIRRSGRISDERTSP